MTKACMRLHLQFHIWTCLCMFGWGLSLVSQHSHGYDKLSERIQDFSEQVLVELNGKRSRSQHKLGEMGFLSGDCAAVHPSEKDQGRSTIWNSGINILEAQLKDPVSINTDLARLALDMEKHVTNIVRSNVGGYHSRTVKGGTRFYDYAEDLDPAGITAAKELLNSIQSSVEEFLNQESCKKGEGYQYSVDFHNSWVNVNRAGDSNAIHSHNRAPWQVEELSGVYYVTQPSDASPLIFADPWYTSPKLIKQDRRSGEEFFNGTRATRRFLPKPGSLLLFPPSFFHGVPPASNVEPRISIAFNLELKRKKQTQACHELLSKPPSFKSCNLFELARWQFSQDQSSRDMFQRADRGGVVLANSHISIYPDIDLATSFGLTGLMAKKAAGHAELSCSKTLLRLQNQWHYDTHWHFNHQLTAHLLQMSDEVKLHLHSGSYLLLPDLFHTSKFRSNDLDHLKHIVEDLNKVSGCKYSIFELRSSNEGDDLSQILQEPQRLRLYPHLLSQIETSGLV